MCAPPGPGGQRAARAPRSLPITLGVSAKRVGEARIPFTAPHQSFGEIDAASEVGESCCACDGVDGGRNGCKCEREMQGDSRRSAPLRKGVR